MGLPPQTLGGASRCLTRFRLRLQLRQMCAAQQNRAILHNTYALCAMRGQEKAPAPAQRINRIMQNVTGFAWPRMFYMGLSPQTPQLASLPGGYALF